MATFADIRYREGTIQWINSQPYQFDTAVCLHLPNSYRHEHNNWDSDGLSKCLRHFFNCVDRKILGSANRKFGARVPRFITHELGELCGWHAHGIISAESVGYSVLEMQKLLQEILNRKILRNHAGGKISGHLFYCEPIQKNYLPYITKSLSVSDRDYMGKIDLENCWLKKPSFKDPAV